MKIAFIYDRINKIGGAERILTALHKAHPNAPFYTAVYNSKSAPWAKDFKVKSSFLNHFPFAKTHHELYPLLTSTAFESFDLSKFDVVVSITSAEAKAVLTSPKTLHLCYCLTPTRYLWSHTNLYQKTITIGRILKMFKPFLQKIDTINSSRPDAYLTISKTVQQRIKKYYHQDSTVIYPPVETDKFSLSPAKDYFLLVSRLVSYKKVDLAIKAFNKLDLPLIIIGTGREEGKLKKLAKANIKFVGLVSEAELINYYQNCKALIMPQEEDFGLVSIEAQAAGKPVIAFRAGGAEETVVENKTGIFFNQPTVDSLVDCVKQFKSRNWDPKLIKSHAEKYNTKIFITNFKTHLEAQWQKHKIKFQ